MKKYILILCVLITGLSACKKKEETPFDANIQATADDAQIQAYLKANSITAVKDASGLYYTVVTEGTGNYPAATNSVTVNYIGKLMTSGTQFDARTGLTFSLGEVIKGWTIGLQKVRSGGRINLYIPSALGYGNVGNSAIPANSVLIFTIDLISIR